LLAAVASSVLLEVAAAFVGDASFAGL